MQKLILTLIMMTIGTGTMSIKAQTMSDFDLGDHKWQDRVLRVFSPNTYNADYRKQVQILRKSKPGIQERDLKVFYALEQSSASAKGEIIPDGEVQDLRKNFEVSASDYTVILIGKDGTEKLRTHEAISAQKLFEEIDSMPMRKLEMKDGEG